MTAFAQGDRVRSRVTAQGLVQDDVYEVTAVIEKAYMWGTFVSYWVRPVDSATREATQQQLLIGNAHLLMEVA